MFFVRLLHWNHMNVLVSHYDIRMRWFPQKLTVTLVGFKPRRRPLKIIPVSAIKISSVSVIIKTPSSLLFLIFRKTSNVFRKLANLLTEDSQKVVLMILSLENVSFAEFCRWKQSVMVSTLQSFFIEVA